MGTLKGVPKPSLPISVDLNHFLLDLYQLALRTPSPEFGDAALERLKQEIAFGSALWGTFTGTPEGPRPHSVHLHGLPGAMLAEYEAVKQHDLMNQRLIERPGRTVAMPLAAVEKRVHPDMVAHVRRWGMQQTLATVVLESPLNLYTIVALYRADARRAFNERERRFKQALMPHLVAAWHINALHFLDTPAEPPRSVRRARALIDPLGIIHNAEPGLVDLLQREAAKWTGPAVPAELLAGVHGATGRYEGAAIVATLLRNLGDRTSVINVRLRAPADTLSERERQVAREFAAGKTYKEIAAAFGTSPATVRSQIQSAYVKLGVSTKIELGKQLAD
jgi:DNA-binding CsgD family transcriptional regulator